MSAVFLWLTHKFAFMSSLINMRHHKHNNKKKKELLNVTVEMDTGKTTF